MSHTSCFDVVKRKKKKRLVESLSCNTFKDIYYLTGDVLGEGSYGRVETCINMFTDTEYAVKIISKRNWCFSRGKVLKEIELYYLCQGQPNIIQLIEFFEEPEYFFLIFEKAYGGQLLSQIQRRVHFTEVEAASIIRDLAQALQFLHHRGIAHRDLKPENVLCLSANSPLPIKLCDFDLCSGVQQNITTPLLQSPVGSAEYMAPEVVHAFNTTNGFDEDDELTYDKKCDIWSLGIIAYILLCGYLPFAAGKCDQDCGWEKGEECSKCTRSLFDSICNGTLVFHEHYWSSISYEAQDLISRLLVRDASLRLDTKAILEHPFIVNGGSSAPLETPSMLRRQTSYQLTEEQLGQGSSSQVVTAINRSNGQALAVKVVAKNTGMFSRSNMLREIETFHLCEGHANILQLLEFYEEATCFYLVFEKMEGGQLLDHIKERELFTEKEAARIIRDLARALQFLHKKGIAHRDLKPENVLCLRPDSIHPVKLCDFDLASNASTKISTPKLQTPVGSLEYMAPEVSPERRRSYNKKCDLWSLGVIMHILLSGSPPFSGDCGQECGWDNGEACLTCQTKLSTAIQEGSVNLDKPFWANISQPAKDLLLNLLEKNVDRRIDTRSLLIHPWITSEGTSHRLGTPRVLRRHASTQGLSNYATSTFALNKAFSFSESENHLVRDGLSPSGSAGLQRVAQPIFTRSSSTTVPGDHESVESFHRFQLQKKMERDHSRDKTATFRSIVEHPPKKCE
eukprot:maker-scaffold424_size175595-snap-gene-0.25 protein:Tk01549 transcript:maker-scaffold424_size175595-snap-gene-0.25-mRNA-1 annotation:"hypothetical protein DAPPUDRAFT_306600"